MVELQRELQKVPTLHPWGASNSVNSTAMCLLPVLLSHGFGMSRQRIGNVMVKRVFGILFALGLLCAVVWASDRVTLQGERTIYTVNCEQGVWQGLECTGRLAAGDRYRYLSLKTRHELIFWIAASKEPSGKLIDCTVENRGNWSCKANADSARSITHEMVNDKAKPDPTALTRPFHAVPKWKWWLLRAGLPGLSEANY